MEIQIRRSGIRLKIDQEVDPEVRRAIKEFARWLRKQMDFPIRVPIYIKKDYQIKTKSRELVSAIFFEPFSKDVEPYIKVASGEYEELKEEGGQDNALSSILASIAHELAHYFQWIHDKTLVVELLEIGQRKP